MAFVIWFLSAIFLLAGTGLALMRMKKSPPRQLSPFPPVTIIKPLKGADSGLEKNLESFFALDYPQFELIFSVGEESDPARLIAERVLRRYPNVDARLIVGDVKAGLNPKVNNMIRSCDSAKFELLLISDSNVIAKKDYLQRMVSQLTDKIGVITAAVAGVHPNKLGGYLESVYLNTFYARGLHLAFAFGKPCVIGKSMLFRKKHLEKMGGMRSLAGYLAEDYVIGEEINKMGLKVHLMIDPVDQYIGEYSFTSFWQRHLRWGRIRKAHAPLAFFLEPLFTPFISAAFGAFAFRDSVQPLFFFVSHVFIWGLCDFYLSAKFYRCLNWRIPMVWLLRELLSLPQWLAVASGNTINWRGTKLRLAMGGKIYAEDLACIMSEQHFSGDQLRALTKLKATI